MPPGQRKIEREELSRLFGQLVRARLVVVPFAVGLVAWVLVTDPAPWRRAALSLVALLALSLFVFEWARYRRRGLAPSAIQLNLSAATVLQLAAAAATGGMESPFVYAALPITLLTVLFLERGTQLALVALQLAAFLVMAAIGATGAVPDFNLAAFGGGPRLGADTAHLWTHAAFLGCVVVGLHALGRALRRTFEAVLSRRLMAQQESLRAYEERAEELTALSAEIAHELKNPLASVKGLAGLLAQGAEGGKGAERLGVLRREVDRMQSILDEFLNFSRPLVPLALGESDLLELAREVGALHEGISRERGVALEVRGEAVPARCDARKVKQILVNLVQNAFEASPAGGAVEVETARAGDGGVRVRVLDRGRGLDPSLGDAAFAPGVTTKARGSGLGLTIARALARQHGGELLLSSRPGGGTVAELRLPSRPGAVAGGEAA
jgi:two-component system, NtrC family, sensor histidine kinase HydH